MKSEYIDVEQPVSELVSLVYNHFGKNPMGWTHIDKLTEYAHNSHFVELVFELFFYLQNHPNTFLDINSSQMYKIIYKFQLASKSLPYDPKQIAECYLFLANYAIHLYNHTYEHVNEAKENVIFYPVKDEHEQHKLGLFSALLRGYSETLFCDEHTVSEEIISPVTFDNGELIIYRKFINLSAEDLYDDIKECPYKSITMMYKYDNLSEKPRADIVGNLYVNSNILHHLNGYYIEIAKKNGEIIIIDSIDQIVLISRYFQCTMKNIINHFKQFSLIDRLRKKIFCEYYALKPYLDIQKKEWKPCLDKLNINDISSTKRPIVKANEELENASDEEEFLKRLLELNNPLIHWDCL